MPNIYDVARKAGVSTSTVSHVLNRTRFVSEVTTAKVEAAIKELNYQPSSLARAMVVQETRTIGLIVPDNINAFFAELARGIENYGFDAGYSVMLCNSGRSAEREIAYLEMLISKRVDGVIYMTSDLAAERLESLHERDIPVVTFDRSYEGVDAILIDNFQGGYDATKHLIGLGHRRIGCLAGPDSPSRSHDRVVGYQEALRGAGLEVDEALVEPADWTHRGGQRASERLLSLGSKPSALFACNDTMAIGALAYLHSNGYRVPEDVSVVGFDNIIASAFAYPPLTTIATPIQDIGHRLCRLLLERISGGQPTVTRHITLRSRLLLRKSTAPPAH